MQMRIYAIALVTSASLVPLPAAAQDNDKPDLNILVGGGVQTKPSFPGASTNTIGFVPVVEVWREGEQFPVETPDESFGFALIGERGKTSFGPAIAFAPSRKRDEPLPGIRKIGFGVEVGGFAETYLTPNIRARAELRRALGASNALTGDAAVDFVYRGKNDAVVATVGPRVRWGSKKYNGSYFGVSAPESLVSGLPEYQPKSGLYAYGASAGTHVRLSRQWGLYGFAGYDRITGPAAKSPIVAQYGSKDNWTAGIAITYRFTIAR